MKKGFLLKLLLCMLLASITAFGMTACDVFDGDTSGDNLNQDQVNEQILEVYDAYVEYAKENGSEPLSYEEWLISIRGEAGKDGVTPLFRINEHNEKWEMSLDNGKTWTSLGIKAKGDKVIRVKKVPLGQKATRANLVNLVKTVLPQK